MVRQEATLLSLDGLQTLAAAFKWDVASLLTSLLPIPGSVPLSNAPPHSWNLAHLFSLTMVKCVEVVYITSLVGRLRGSLQKPNVVLFTVVSGIWFFGALWGFRMFASGSRVHMLLHVDSCTLTLQSPHVVTCGF